MSIVTKIILDTAEYNRLLAIEKAYHELKSTKLSEANQSGTGKTKNCSCSETEKKCICTPPLSQIIATNEKARAVNVPPRGILPSITDPNEVGYGNSLSTVKSDEENKEKQLFDPASFRTLANQTDKWYFLGHFEEK